ncbi:protein phosphatase 2C domain-containing protein [Haloarcula halophila]|uniref:protein phosphatase 2C domain-containing protein n=1 Tax=Haloarcula TaxID=2237 RepID=UPI0023E40DB6|nr:protein phosphatase 2C domain-containing protein [Halomicroarcula sp. DFY41]
MRYSTHYDTGDAKRGDGINEDSLSMTVFEDGHREGHGIGSERGTDEPTPSSTRSVGVFVLADGAGGHDAGDVASYLATTGIAERLAPVAIRAARGRPERFDIEIDDGVLPEESTAVSLRSAITDAVVETHRDILRYVGSAGTRSYTTAVAGICLDGRLHLGWVGDSRTYVVNEATGRIARLTKDHALVQRWAEAGEIDELESQVHPRGNEITRALGGAGGGDAATATVEVDTRTVDLYAEDTVLVTSDGLVDAQTDAPALYRHYVDSGKSEAAAERIRDKAVTDENLRDVVLSADSLPAAGETFIEMANERGGKDNLSVLLFGDDGLPETPAEDSVPVRDIDPSRRPLDRDTALLSDE